MKRNKRKLVVVVEVVLTRGRGALMCLTREEEHWLALTSCLWYLLMKASSSAVLSPPGSRRSLIMLTIEVINVQLDLGEEKRRMMKKKKKE